MAWSSNDRSGERGYVAGELALGIGLLVFPVALLVLTLPTWSERQTTARSIAREVSRVVAVAGVCDRTAASQTGYEMARNLGLAPGDIFLRVVLFRLILRESTWENARTGDWRRASHIGRGGARRPAAEGAQQQRPSIPPP